MHICILGAGIMGITSAYRLLKEGHQVTLIDERKHVGEGTSHGNGAQLSYSYVAPLADPSILHHLSYYLFSKESPLTLRPKLDPAQWSWIIQFLKACNTKQAHQTTIELLRLAFYSRDTLHQIQKLHQLKFDYREAGKLVMYTDPEALQNAQKQLDFQAQFGCSQKILPLSECIDIEPALGNANRPWVGGVYTPSEEVGDCAMFCEQLYDVMKTNPNFTFMGSTKVTKLNITNNTLNAVSTSQGEVAADAFVLAMGSYSQQLAKQAGFSLPVYPLKGYSITVPLKNEQAQTGAPQVSITDIAKKIVYARLGDRLRVAGRVEILGLNDRIPQKAIEELKNGVTELFPQSAQFTDDSTISPWAGFRPTTPTGLPIIGTSPINRLFLNVGQGSLGWTLSFGSAEILADTIANRPTHVDKTSYQLS